MIEYIPATGSTDADLAGRIRGGDVLPEGFWLVTDRQTAGRGRLGREWHDGAGNFMGSTLVRPGHGDPLPHTLALVSGLAVLGAVRECLPDDLTLRLKWPNDLLAGTAKLAGVLLEAEGPLVVIGIGVNLVSAPKLPDRVVTSLAALGGAVERNRFAELLAKAFDLELERWRTYGLEPLIARWCQAAHAIGAPLSVQSRTESPLHGTFGGLNAEGALQLRLADGSVRTIHAGEVTLSD